MSFSDLKRKSSNNFQFLQKELEKSSTEQKSGADERLWKPELDASGNGYAVLRFLPAPDGETVPWAKLYSHGFQGPGGWFIENSLTTRGDKDPVSEYNSVLWNNGTESGKEQARKQKRKLSYYSNIYVVKDPKNPENEGKVFLYRYGKKIFDKIMGAMQPEFQDETPVNPFDLWEGANFKLKIKTVAGYWNYDSAEFDRTAALAANDDELEAIWKQAYSLEAYTADDQFKSYDELKTRLDSVLNVGRPPAVSVESEEYDPAPVSGGFNDPAIMAAATPVPQSMKNELSDLKPSADDDDALSYFARLAND
jgi:hypothetical protein